MKSREPSSGEIGGYLRRISKAAACGCSVATATELLGGERFADFLDKVSRAYFLAFSPASLIAAKSRAFK